MCLVREFMYSGSVNVISIQSPCRALRLRFRRMPRRLANASVAFLWLLIFLLSWAPQALGEENDDTAKNKFAPQRRVGLPHRPALDTSYHYAGELRDLGIDNHLTRGLRLAGHSRGDLELAVVGQKATGSRTVRVLGNCLLGHAN